MGLDPFDYDELSRNVEDLLNDEYGVRDETFDVRLDGADLPDDPVEYRNAANGYGVQQPGGAPDFDEEAAAMRYDPQTNSGAAIRAYNTDYASRAAKRANRNPPPKARRSNDRADATQQLPRRKGNRIHDPGIKIDGKDLQGKHDGANQQSQIPCAERHTGFYTEKIHARHSNQYGQPHLRRCPLVQENPENRHQHDIKRRDKAGFSRSLFSDPVLLKIAGNKQRRAADQGTDDHLFLLTGTDMKDHAHQDQHCGGNKPPKSIDGKGLYIGAGYRLC